MFSLILQIRGEPVKRRDGSANPPAVQPDRPLQKLQNDHGCKSLPLMISVFLVANGFEMYLHVVEVHWKFGISTLKGCSKARDHSRVLWASFLPHI